MLKFIDNIGDYFTANYFDEDFAKRVLEKSGYAADDYKSFNQKISGLKDRYYKYKQQLLEGKLRTKDKIVATHDFHTLVLNALGYDGSHPEYNHLWHLSELEVVPVRHTLYRGEQPHLMVLEMQPLIPEGDEVPDGLFEQRYNVEDEEEGGSGSPAGNPPQRYHRSQWDKVFQVPEGLKISPVIVNKMISTLFLLKQEERPRYILLLAGNVIFLLEQEKWFRGSYLRFDLEELFSEAVATPATRNYYSLLYFLLAKETLSPDGDMVLLDQLDEDSHRSAYEVTKDLKEGIIGAVEALANEAVWYWKNQLHQNLDETEDQFEHDLKDDCLTIIYRLLFIFYAESRQDLTILPTADGTYQKGYSLEMLRDLEQVPLHSDTSRNGYFFHESLATLFGLLNGGYRENENGSNKSFRVRHLDSPLFNNDKLKRLKDVKFRNVVWQSIIVRLSLSREQKGRSRGRISYANLGINQLGSVYESLLAYRGFFTEGEYIEVHKAGKPEEGTYLVPRTRLDDFREEEILHDADHRLVVIPKGTFLYRLSGRDRQQSASYYTPEVLTRCTVKYTLQPLLARLDLPAADKNRLTALDLLDLKLLEPAMGAAAFHNELINQLAEAYLSRRQDELKHLKPRVAPDKYQEELQKVKAFIATTNVYGVDLNPTAIELGKLSLWLNVIHRDMETPFFGNRLAVGNAVVGAWLRVYPESAVSEEFALTASGRPGKTPVKKEWWEQAPRPLRFGKGKGPDRKPTELYHFLLPDKNMVASAGAKLLKDRHPAEAKRVSEMRKGWCAPLTPTELRQVRGLSAKVDELLREYYRFQRSIRTHTGGHLLVWGGLEESKPGAQLGFKTYDEKEHLNDQRHRHGAPYFKLKMLMDYWCALWFWDVRQAVDLPTRQQYWDDLSSIVQLDLNASTVAPAPVGRPLVAMPAPQLTMFGGGSGQQLPLAAVVAEPEPADTPELGEEAIIAYTNRRGLFDDNQRLRLVRSLAAQHRFFHPQLEFLEVFWERGGFDLLAGNPPWLKVEFTEQNVIGESFPELLIREDSATDVSQLRDVYLEKEVHQEMYLGELVSATAIASFLQATQNYPLLYGQQTNLYKCVLENGFGLLAPQGYMGLVHPEGVFDDAKGQLLRKNIYSRIKYHFQFRNELALFAEVGHKKVYSVSVYYGTKGTVQFTSINNLFTPGTIEGSLVHGGSGEVGGYKVLDKLTGRKVWNITPHKSRIIQISEKELRVLALVFESSTNWQETKLVSIHSTHILSILEKLSLFRSKVSKSENKFTLCWHETNAQKDGYIKKKTKYPEYEQFELIYGGPHFFVSSPFYKNPRHICTKPSSYDTINLAECGESFFSRTNFIPAIGQTEFSKTQSGFIVGYEEPDTSGYAKPIYDSWFDYFKLCFSGQVDPVTERTLQSAIVLPKVSHIDSVISIIFREQSTLVEFAGLTASLVMDFYLKTMGVPKLNKSTLENFPLGIAARYKPALFARTLLLNCVNKHYAPLWESQWQVEFPQQAWSREDARLKPFAELGPEWEQSTPLRNWLERRQALVEIDVLSAQALGLTLAELELLYLVQFPVLQQNEDDTWYDQRGNIVFTCSKGLNGVGLDRADWEAIRQRSAGETYEHTITKSELYQGQKVTYYPPFEKRDRVADYQVAWTHFEATLPSA
jgi:hypothetical protein